MKKLSDQIRSTSGFRIGISGTRINVRRSIFKEYADKVAQLEAEIAIQHKYQANMMDEDAQPLPEWIAYFDELEALESGGE